MASAACAAAAAAASAAALAAATPPAPGRRPELFPAFTRNGYASRFLAAASVDWMGLREQVFGDVQQSLETDWPAGLTPDQKDGAMLEEA